MAIHKVLMVDDSKTELMVISDLLVKNGYSVRTAENAEEAFRRLGEEKPELILIYIQRVVHQLLRYPFLVKKLKLS